MYCLQARLFFALVLLDMARGKFECWLQTFFLLPKVHTHMFISILLYVHIIYYLL